MTTESEFLNVSLVGVDGVLPSCTANGTIGVLAQDYHGNLIPGLLVYVNGVLNQTTTNSGSTQIKMNGASCTADQNISVKCADTVTTCGTQTTRMEINNDTDNLVFDCTKCLTTKDLYASQADIVVDVQAKKVNVTVHSTGVTGYFNVSIKRQDATTLSINDQKEVRINITTTGTAVAQFTFTTLNQDDLLHIYLDDDKEIQEATL